jgi:hypothetical protein
MLEGELKNDRPDDGGSKPQIRLKKPQEYFTNSSVCTIMDDLRRQWAQESLTQPLPTTFDREAEDWAFLRHRTIGAEGEFVEPIEDGPNSAI